MLESNFTAVYMASFEAFVWHSTVASSEASVWHSTGLLYSMLCNVAKTHAIAISLGNAQKKWTEFRDTRFRNVELPRCC